MTAADNSLTPGHTKYKKYRKGNTRRLPSGVWSCSYHQTAPILCWWCCSGEAEPSRLFFVLGNCTAPRLRGNAKLVVYQYFCMVPDSVVYYQQSHRFQWQELAGCLAAYCSRAGTHVRDLLLGKMFSKATPVRILFF